MEFLNVFLSSLLSVIVLFILTKLMGKRQMSQLSMFDYIIGITIGSIAAEMATSLEGDIFLPIISMIVYGFSSFIISYITAKSLKLRRFITGKAVILYNNGKFYTENLKHAKIDINEFLCTCRNNGYFNLSNIQMAILEENGRISFLPASDTRPVTPGDMNITVPKEAALVNVVIQGKILSGNLNYLGLNTDWLHNSLNKQGIKNTGDIFLATCDNQNNLTVFSYNNVSGAKDIFL